MAGLTKNQELFAQLVASGMSQSGAYREAYNTAKQKPSTVWRNASALANENAKVSARIAEIRQKAIDESPWTKQRSFSEKVSFLEKVKQTIERDGRVGQGTGTVLLGVVKELDEMLEDIMPANENENDNDLMAALTGKVEEAFNEDEVEA